MKIVVSKKLNQAEIDQVVSIHVNILVESVLNRFGEKFLKIVYKQLVKNRDNIVILLKDGGKVIGFLVATTDSQNFYKDIVSTKFWQLSFEIFSRTITSPKFFLKTIAWSFLKSKKTNIPAALQFIAIDSKYQSNGYGSKMVGQLNKELIKRKIYQYRVGTKANNRKSNNFYRKLNFKLIYSDVILGEKNNYYLSPNITASLANSRHGK